MKAAVLYQPGKAENFRIESRSVPRPNKGEVLVRVKAFGLNRSELMTRKGLSPDVMFPRVLGIECVGEIVDDPSGEYKAGQKVAAFMNGMGRDYDGSYAEFVVLPKSILYPFTSNLPWATLGAMPEMFQTVYGSLHLALHIQPGETILIRGGTSSIGLLAIQLAKNAGLKVISTTRSLEKKQFLLDNGSDVVLIEDGNLKIQLNNSGLDKVEKVLELVGTRTLKDSLNCIKAQGIVCMTGMLSEEWSLQDFAPMDYIPAAGYLTIYDSGQIHVENPHFQAFVNDVEQGLVRLNLGPVFSLDEIVKAHELMESNSAGGKIVILNDAMV